MRGYPTLANASAKSIYGMFRDDRCPSASPVDQAQDSRYAHDARALRAGESYEDVAREQGQLQVHPGPIAPSPLGAIQGQVVLNAALSEMFCNGLFMTARCVHRKPARFAIESSPTLFSYSTGNAAELQGFAILTWVKVFHSMLKTASFRSDGR